MAKREVDIAAMLGGQLAKVSESDTPVRMIPLADIHSNPRNFYPRVENLEDLEASIQANGLLEPLTVVPDESGGYRLISGHNRFAALRRIHSEKYRDEVPCLVLPTMDEHVELSAIIEANRQRVKTSALLAEEADKLTKAYMARKRAGENLPGRIRDRVAEAMQISKTKLANLSAIKNGIKVPGIMRKWEKDEIPEAAALEIARLPVEAQYRLLDWVIDGHYDYSIRNVKKFALMWSGCKQACPETGKFCLHAEAIMDHDYHGGQWHGSGCCRQCLSRDTCPAACQYAGSEEVGEAHEPETGGMGIAPPPTLEKREEWTAEDWTQLCKTFSDRLRSCREQLGLDRADFAEKIGEYKTTYSTWENGGLPGSGRLPKLAKTLGVSIDYLFGLTDAPAPRNAPTVWQPLDQQHWPTERQLVVIAYDNPLGGTCYEAARCVGGYHDLYPFEDTDVGCELDAPSHGDYDVGYWWMPLSEMEAGHG